MSGQFTRPVNCWPLSATGSNFSQCALGKGGGILANNRVDKMLCAAQWVGRGWPRLRHGYLWDGITKLKSCCTMCLLWVCVYCSQWSSHGTVGKLRLYDGSWILDDHYTFCELALLNVWSQMTVLTLVSLLALTFDMFAAQSCCGGYLRYLNE